MSRFRIVAIIFFSILCGSGLFAQNSGIMRAVFQINNEDYKSAYEELIEITPGSAEASYYYEALGRSAYLAGNTEEAIIAWNNRTKYSKPGVAFLELAKVYFEIKDYDAAYKFLTKHLQSAEKLPYNSVIADPAFEDFNRDRQWIRFWSEKWYTPHEDQIAELNSLMLSDFPSTEPLEDLLIENENDENVLLLAAQFYNKLKMDRQCKQMINKIIKPDCEDKEVLNIVADLFIQNKDYSKALDLYLKSLKTNPYQADIWMKIIDIYEEIGDDRSSMKVMEELNGYGVENTKLWLSLARNQMNDKPDSSMALLNQVLGANPLDQTALNLRSELHLKRGSSDDAIYDLTQSLDIKPNQPDVYFSRAQIRYNLGDQTGACYDWKKALRYGHRKALNMLYKYCDY